jgi:hypothetical protein
MKWFSRLSLFLGVLSIGLSGFLVLGDERIRVEAFAGRFPLTSLGEGVVSMVIPLALSIAGFLVGIVCVQHRVGRWGALSSALGLFAAWIILGRQGFEYLF